MRDFPIQCFPCRRMAGGVGAGFYSARGTVRLPRRFRANNVRPYNILSCRKPGISRALKTVRRTVFTTRDADAGRGLFDSRTPLLPKKFNTKKKAQPLTKLSFLVTRTGIEPMLQP